MERKNWSYNELIVAFNLYCKTSFGRIHNRNPEIIALAKALGRTPSAVSWKLANFARLDPSLKERSIAGAAHGSKLEQEIWDEFSNNWEKLSFESEVCRLEIIGAKQPVVDDVFPDGKTREAIVRVRVNQGFFRAAVLAAYDSKCCVTGLAVGELLCASHIIPWSKDIKNRTNPRNGLCLNPTHDRAFDRGLMTITIDYKVELSSRAKRKGDSGLASLLLPYEGVVINLPEHFAPEKAFLEYHREHIFQQ